MPRFIVTEVVRHVVVEKNADRAFLAYYVDGTSEGVFDQHQTDSREMTPEEEAQFEFQDDVTLEGPGRQIAVLSPSH